MPTLDQAKDRKGSWTEERRRAQAERMLQVNDRLKGKGRRPSMTPEQKAEKSEQMKQLNERMRTDAELKAKVIEGQKRVRGTPEARERQALHMQVTMADPKNRDIARDHVRRMNRDPEMRKKQNEGRFGDDRERYCVRRGGSCQCTCVGECIFSG